MAATSAAARPAFPTRARAVLFDLDGTLLDTEPASTEALSAISAEFGGNACDWELKKALLGRKALGPDGWAVRAG